MEKLTDVCAFAMMREKKTRFTSRVSGFCLRVPALTVLGVKIDLRYREVG